MNDEIDPTSSNSGDSGATPPPPPPPPAPFGETPQSPQPPQPPQPPQDPTPPQPFIQPGTTPPPPPPSPYGAPAQGTYYSNTQGFNAAGPKNDPFAITALSTGVPAIILGCCCGIFGLILGIIATVFGFLSLGRIEKSEGQLTGKGLAIGGLSCGIVAIVIAIGLFAVNIIFGWSDIGSGNF